MKLICLGDSLTFGFGIRKSDRWVELVADAFPDVEVKNCGINGDTTAGMLCRFYRMMPFGADTALLIMGGGNDIFYSGTSAGARANIGAIIHGCFAAGVLPIVGIQMPIEKDICPEKWSRVVDYEAAAREIDFYRSWLKEYCRAFNVKTVDFGAGWPEGRLSDGMHPDEEGHRLMADKVAECLRELTEIKRL